MVQLSMTLSNLWPRFQGHDIFRRWISQKKRAIVIDLDWPLNASSPLSASAELLVTYIHACMHACIHTYINTYIIHTYIHTNETVASLKSEVFIQSFTGGMLCLMPTSRNTHWAAASASAMTLKGKRPHSMRFMCQTVNLSSVTWSHFTSWNWTVSYGHWILFHSVLFYRVATFLGHTSSEASPWLSALVCSPDGSVVVYSGDK